MRAVLVLLVLLVAPLAAPLAAAATSPTGPATSPTVSWWGPEDFEQGWNLRVPVQVRNSFNGPIANLPVTAEIDLGVAVMASGWPTMKVGGRPVLQSFALDPASVRVVEYTNFQVPRVRAMDATPILAVPSIAGPEGYTLPVSVVKGTLEAPQAAPFDAKANPTVSVTWVAPGMTDPSQPRSFMVYFDVVQNGKRPAQDPDRLSSSSLGGLYWIGRGTVVFGEGTRVTVTAVNPRTTVSVYRFGAGAPIPLLDKPAMLGSGASRTFPVGGTPEPWMVRANGPIVATAGPGFPAFPVAGFLPSWDGTLLGMQWNLPAPSGRFLVFNPGVTPARVSGPDVTMVIPAGGGRSFDATGDPFSLTATAPVLVEASPRLDVYPFVSASGGPLGPVLYGTLEGVDFEGTLTTASVQVGLSSLGGAAAPVVLTTIGDGRQAVPRPTAAAPTSTASPRAAPDWALYQPRADALGPAVMKVLDPSNPAAPDPRAATFALAGRGLGSRDASFASPLGGQQARNFSVPLPVSVFAYHNATQISVQRDGVVEDRFVLDRYGHRQVEASWGRPALVSASKPVAVVPHQENNPVSYGAGMIEAPAVLTGPAQYRGFLIGIDPADGEDEPMVRSISFGGTARFNLTVTNLGRAMDGSPIADRARFSLPPLPPGWNAALEPTEVELGPGATATVALTVRAPETRGSGDRLVLPVRATSVGNPNMTDEVTTITLLRERRGVGLWFEEKDGPTELTLRFQAGKPRDVSLVVANTGSARDTVRLAATNAEAGWTARFIEDGKPLFSMELASGQSRKLVLHVEPPAPGGLMLPSSFTLSASSTNDTTVSAKALLNGLIATETKLRLEAEDEVLIVRPGEPATFHLRLLNAGTGISDARLNATGDLPIGWGAPDFRFRGESLSVVENQLDSVAPTGSTGIPIELVVRVPANATGGLSTGLLAQVAPAGETGGSPDLLPLTIHVEPFVDLASESLGRQTLWPGENVTLPITIANRGNVDAKARVLMAEVPETWHVRANASIDIPRSSNATLVLNVAVPPGAPPADHVVRLALVDAGGHRVLVEAPLRVGEGARLVASGPSIAVLPPGLATNVTIDVTNVGNAPSNATFSFELPDGWVASAQPLPLVVSPMASARMQLTITAPDEALDPEMMRVLETGTLHTDPLLGLQLVPRQVALRLLRAEILDTGQPGVVAVRGALVNEANVTAENVTVALVAADGRVLRETVLERVPFNAPRVVVIAVNAEGLPSEARLVIDPAGRFVQEDRSDDSVNVRLTVAGRDAPVPPWVPVIAAGFAVVLARRRHPEPGAPGPSAGRKD